MSTPKTPPTPEAMKSRIITHMNADHAPSLALYLEHYLHVPSFTAGHARLTDLTLTTLTLRSGSATYTIPIDPPLSSYAEARERLVSMDRTSKAGLGRDDVVVTRYISPRGFEAVVFTACLLTFTFLHRRSWFAADESVLAEVMPGAARFLYWVQPWVFWPMLVAHASEAYWMHRSRLVRCSVPRGGKVWGCWVLSCFIEGVGALWRFDREVLKERRAKEAKKH